MGIKDLTIKAVDAGFIICYEEYKKPSGHTKYSHTEYEYKKEAIEDMDAAFGRFAELYSMVENSATSDREYPMKGGY